MREVVSERVSEVVREASDESEEAGREEERQERLRRAHAIATELLDTEKHYVAILHLIDQVINKLISRPTTTQLLIETNVLMSGSQCVIIQL